MSIIVDGYNYIGRSQEFRLHDPKARDQIIYLMGQYCGKAKKSLTLVFDGNYFVHHANRKRRYGRVTVIYTSPIYTADDAIKKMIKNQDRRRRKSMLIVTSDADILQYATSHGTPTAKSEEFEERVYRTLSEKKKIDRVNIQISEQEVQEWLKIFGPEPKDVKVSSRRTSSSSKPDTFSQQLAQQKSKKGKKKTPKKSAKRQKNLPNTGDIDRVNVHLSEKEVDEWMSIFGEDDSEDE